MTSTDKAPERIWAGVLTDEYRGMVGTQIRVWGNNSRVGTDETATEYVRSDLHEAALARIAELEDQCKRADNIIATGSRYITKLELDNANLRKALAKIYDGYGPNHLSKFARDTACAALQRKERDE